MGKKTKNKKWKKPNIAEWYPEWYNAKDLDTFDHKDYDLLFPIRKFSKGSTAKKKKPRGVGIASRGYGKAMR